MSPKKEKELLKPVFPKATLKRVVSKHTIRKETRISNEGLDQLSMTLDELAGWIILESEKLVISEGKLKITSGHISEAVKIYFGNKG